jgi:hypothetical protein
LTVRGQARAKKGEWVGDAILAAHPRECASLVNAKSESDEAIQRHAQAALDCFAGARNDKLLAYIRYSLFATPTRHSLLTIRARR